MSIETNDDTRTPEEMLGYLVQDLRNEIERMEQLKAKFPPKGTLQDFERLLGSLQTVISFFEQHPELAGASSVMDWLSVLVERMGQVEPYYPDQSSLAGSIQRICPAYASLRCVGGSLQKLISAHVRSSFAEVTTTNSVAVSA